MARLICILSLVACAACVTGGGDIPDQASRFATLRAEFAAVDPSNPAQLPMSGSASYDGVALLTLPVQGAAQPAYGDLDVSVNFGRNRGGISGEIGDISGDVGTFDGTLSLSGGRLDRGVDPDTDFTYTAGLDGTLTLDATQYDIDGTARGEFLGRFQDGTQGVISGTITVDGNRDIFDGSYIAERRDP